MLRVLLGTMWWRITIVSVVFIRGGLITGELCRVNLVRLGEDLRWLSKLLDIYCGNLVNILEFMDVSLKLRQYGQDHGQFFARLNII